MKREKKEARRRFPMTCRTGAADARGRPERLRKQKNAEEVSLEPASAFDFSGMPFEKQACGFYRVSAALR